MAGLKAWRFTSPLKRPLILNGKTHTVRQGVLLQRDDRWAEASPLPGFSLESIDDVISALRNRAKNSPALNFAMSALDQPLKLPLTVPYNQLLSGDAKRILNDVKSCGLLGCRAVKLKVGRDDLNSEIDLVKKVRASLPNDVRLRLDANRAWSFEEATMFCDAVTEVDIEYIEEPLRDFQLLEKLYSQSRVNYALDETLLQHRSLEAWPNAAALICKPTLLGGRASVERLSKTGKPIVFSAAFESGIGIARIAQLAQEYSPHIPAGLDTLDWLSTNWLLASPQKGQGLITFDKQPMVDVDSLENIDL